MNLQPLLDALDLQEDAARTLADELRAQIDELQTRLREVDAHLEHLVITREIVTGLADRFPVGAPDLPKHPDSPASSPPSTIRPDRYEPWTRVAAAEPARSGTRQGVSSSR
ncbi:hypothetical protein OG783_33705 (plasmid) [Streptomyces jietaisiensis]|uniref:hypothetical protein n=1 Tax=Streptomyces griseoaurantiacus TaxID=68213 RepID=UPI002F910972